ncbi:response regulator [Amycolatopsis benzoatilytica]|uniref:response regulator n=1 Tax=Amycolatopsis benzoatilytica TaxID=346045 RepID=UPI00039B158C|nr:response regulator transcription factor [Amycolatopsis benzoatilytica]
MNEPIRVLVVDDHPVVTQGVALLLRSQPNVVLAGSARTGREALEAAAALDPDVVLLDLRLPDMLATEVIRKLRTVRPAARVLLFTAYADHAALPAALEEGVVGCLLKDVSTTDLASAIQDAHRGQTVMDPRVDAASGNRLREALLRVGLTRREYEVLRLVATGHTNPEVAAELGLTRNTVKTYLQSAMGKLGARNRVEAIAKASEARLL